MPNQSREDAMTQEVSEFMGSVKADMANIKFMIEKLDRKFENQNLKMDATVQAMQKIVNNCRAEARQENMGRDETVASAHKRIDEVVKDTNANLTDIRFSIANIREDLKWYGGALAVASAIISLLVALVKEHMPFFRGV